VKREVGCDLSVTEDPLIIKVVRAKVGKNVAPLHNMKVYEAVEVITLPIFNVDIRWR
jgi:hypothetical protein